MGNLLLVKEKKVGVRKAYEVPRHPEFVFVKAISKDSWEARNSQNNEMVMVKRIEKNNFFEYEITAV